jgi:hypothetical protein
MLQLFAVCAKSLLGRNCFCFATYVIEGFATRAREMEMWWFHFFVPCVLQTFAMTMPPNVASVARAFVATALLMTGAIVNSFV